MIRIGSAAVLGVLALALPAVADPVERVVSSRAPLARKLATLRAGGLQVAQLPERAIRLTPATPLATGAELRFDNVQRVDPRAGVATLGDAGEAITLTWRTRPGSVYLVDCAVLSLKAETIDVVVGTAGTPVPISDGRVLVVAAAVPGQDTRRIVLLGHAGVKYGVTACEVTRAK